MLASIALLNQSYALLAGAAEGRDGGACAGGALVREAARCVGSDGMVGGQVVDLETRAGARDADALACRTTGPSRQPNFWAGFVGTAILIFFALIALAYSLFPVALIGFGLCAVRLLSLRRFQPI